MAGTNQARTGARILVDSLLAQGADMAFSVAGESYLALLDALYDVQNKLRVITCRHEAGAAHMAEAYGKLTGKPGLCLVTRGPGACHAAIGVHCAAQDSTPMVLLVGQVDRDHAGREAFQEIDYRRMFGSVVKWVEQIDQTARIPELVGRAFQTSVSGRPGPVVLALPEDMQREEAEASDPPMYQIVRAHPGAEQMSELRRMLSQASRPVVLVGGGGWTPEACADIVAFAAANELPVCCSFRRQDIFDNAHHCYVGDLAIAPIPSLVPRVKRSDLLIVVGSRLDEIASQRYTLLDIPKPRQALVHVHQDAELIGRVFKPNLAIQSGMPEFARAARALAPVPTNRWRASTVEMRGDYEDSLEPEGYDGALDLGRAMVFLRDRLPPDSIIALDAGNFSGWPMRFLTWRQPRTQLGPQAGAMGHGVPAAVAAKLVHPDRTVVGFCGDGGFMMSGQELATAVHHGASPVILVFNNGMYGTIRMHQEREHPGREIATALTNPDFSALARAYGCHGETVARTEEFAPAFERALESGKPAVIDLKMDPDVITTRTTLSKIRAASLTRRA
ncbi:MAG: thiamine pyrophosphate-binding protein [Alphaproteobacteria bacterium]